MKRDSAEDSAERSNQQKDDEIVQEAVSGILGGLGNITARLGEVAKLAGDAVEQARKQAAAQQTTDSKGGSVVYDVSVRMGLGDSIKRPGPGPSAASSHRAGSPRPARARTPAPPASEVREPHADVFSEGESLLFVFDMPGVEPDAIEVEASPGVLEVSGQGAGRSWRKRLDCPELTGRHELFLSARNGVVRIEARPPAGSGQAKDRKEGLTDDRD